MIEKILRLFYDNLHVQFTINEIAKKTRVSYSYVYKQVEEWKNRDILLIEQRSNRKYCKPNYKNPDVKTNFVKISNQIADDFLKKKKQGFPYSRKTFICTSSKNRF